MMFALVPFANMSLLHFSGHMVGRVPLSQGVLQGFWVVASFLLLAALPIYEKIAKGRVHPASIWIPVSYVAWTVLAFTVIYPSEPAFRLASWILQR